MNGSLLNFVTRVTTREWSRSRLTPELYPRATGGLAEESTLTKEEEMGKVKVGWASRPEFGHLICDIIKSKINPFVHQVDLLIQWANGKFIWAIWCSSQKRYVFSNLKVK